MSTWTQFSERGGTQRWETATDERGRDGGMVSAEVYQHGESFDWRVQSVNNFVEQARSHGSENSLEEAKAKAWDVVSNVLKDIREGKA